MQKKVADVEIAMIDATAVHAPGHLGDAADQRMLPGRWRRARRPVTAVIFETDGIGQFLGNDEGMLARRINATLGESHGGHAGDADFGQSAQCTVFVASAKHWRPQADEIFNDLRPADATVNLDEITAPGNLDTQRAPRLEFAKNLALQRLDRSVRVTPGPQGIERRRKPNRCTHGRSARIMSAARSALL